MSIRERLSGNEASALAMKQINPDVVAAFPITPSTEIPQYFSSFVSNGSVDTEFVAVESEHSAMSACIGAQAARRKSNDSNICKRTCFNVGNDTYSIFFKTSNCYATCKQSNIRAIKYSQ